MNVAGGNKSRRGHRCGGKTCVLLGWMCFEAARSPQGRAADRIYCVLWTLKFKLLPAPNCGSWCLIILLNVIRTVSGPSELLWWSHQQTEIRWVLVPVAAPDINITLCPDKVLILLLAFNIHFTEEQKYRSTVVFLPCFGTKKQISPSQSFVLFSLVFPLMAVTHLF